MTEEPRAFSKFATIREMTVDLFDFWLDMELPQITLGVSLVAPIVKTHKKEREQYYRSIRILWKSSAGQETFHLTDIVWAQVKNATIRVEFTNEGELADRLTEWITDLFGDTVKNVSERKLIDNDNSEKLTDREKEVARCLAAGMSYKEIAKDLHIEPATAKRHVQHIAKKWGAGTEVIQVLQHVAKTRKHEFMP
jgi:DNA-binding CsgD family transcriptional regulator